MTIKNTNKRIQVTIDKELLQETKIIADELNITVSTLISLMLRKGMQEYEEYKHSVQHCDR